MEKLYLASNYEAPEVNLDAQANIFTIEGRSLIENPVAFYQPVLEWLKKYAQEPNELTEVLFKLKYFNSASSKFILQIILALDKIHKAGNKVIVHWYYLPEDEEMKETGEEYRDYVSYEIKLATY